MFHKVKSVEPLANYMLSVKFQNEEQRQYDVKPLFKKIEAFETLVAITGLFEQVKVDEHGYGVIWNDDIDLACEELYHNGKVV